MLFRMHYLYIQSGHLTQRSLISEGYGGSLTQLAMKELHLNLDVIFLQERGGKNQYGLLYLEIPSVRKIEIGSY